MSETKNETIIAKHITIKGLVQGVGFRPFIMKLANELKLNGWVKNTNQAVEILVQGTEFQVEDFIKTLPLQKPQASIISNIFITDSILGNYISFSIEKSSDTSDEVTQISADIAVCDDCLTDMHEHPNRTDYPLVNCCHCGPRFSIIKSLPYDREHTTMKPFKMCPDCAAEYNNIYDRRFHAQPVACNHCGPKYELITSQNKTDSISEILSILSGKLSNGGIFAFKGTGGFHLVCDAENEIAVKRLRQIKLRDTKPFAVMFKNLDTIKEYAFANDAEIDELNSFRRPIVILKEKKSLASSLTLSLGSIGTILPYMPFHHLLFENTNCKALVFTSGNIADEPILMDNEKAIDTFVLNTDGVLVYNRDIYNRTDDSVVMVVNNKTRIIRRSRGYVPAPVELPINCEGIFSSGAELTGTFAIGKENQAIVSQYFGDLQNVENFDFYTESYGRFKNLFRFEPTLAVSDLHPDYTTTTFSRNLNIKHFQVQHHHAHIASVMAEHNIIEPIIGVAFDGTGYGTDGNIWGSEFLIAESTKFKRAFHFEYMPLPGGDKSVLEPWRSAVAYLYSYFGNDFEKIDIPFIKGLNASKTSLLLSAIEKKINSSLSCSAGRLCDAVAALTEICSHPSFHAEAPMRLEATIDEGITDIYPFEILGCIISFKSMFECIISDIQSNTNKSEISAKFHNTLVNVIVTVCLKMKEQFNLSKVALSGGTFQNKYLLKHSEIQLHKNGFEVYTNIQVPSNDAGIALGQMYIAAKSKDQ